MNINPAFDDHRREERILRNFDFDNFNNALDDLIQLRRELESLKYLESRLLKNSVDIEINFVGYKEPLSKYFSDNATECKEDILYNVKREIENRKIEIANYTESLNVAVFISNEEQGE